MTDASTATEAPPVEANGDAWTIGGVSRGASERLMAIRERVGALRTTRERINTEIKELLDEQVRIERLMRAVEKEVKPRAAKRAKKEDQPDGSPIE